MDSSPNVVLVGGGQGAHSAAVALRENGFAGRIFLVSDEAHLPYQRPPLTKGYLSGKTDNPLTTFQTAEEAAALSVELVLGTRAENIDRSTRRLSLSNGSTLPYDHLVLATGARNRDILGRVDGVHAVRTAGEALALREALRGTERVVVLGAGFLGLEVAAAAVGYGCAVLVVEAETRALSRASSPAIAEHMVAAHRAHSVEFAFNTRLLSISAPNGELEAVELDDGRIVPCTALVTSVGVVPNDELAHAASLAVKNGVLVDARLRTSDPAISAIGDCARFPYWLDGEMVRLESVQNATDQGEYIAARLTGHDGVYNAVPWFWTEQYGIKLQIAGLRSNPDQEIRLDGPREGFSLLSFKGPRLLSVESVNMPGHHMKGRRHLAAGATPPSPSDVSAGVF